MAQEIRQKIVLEGEQQYKQALKDAQRNLKTLRTELKAETAELGKNATEQQKNAVKIKNLQQQIKEQEEVVKTYRAALEEVRERYGDNEDAIARWEQKLNEARASLANMKNELDSVGDGMDGVTGATEESVTAANSLADAFKNIGSVADGISGTIETIFGGVVETIQNAVGQLWSLITETAAKANNWTDLAGYFGSTTTEIQKLEYGISDAQGEMSDFVALANQLVFNGKSQKIAEVLGLSDVNYNDAVAFTEAVLDTLSAIDDVGTRNSMMAEIFGGRARNFEWLVTNWQHIRQGMEGYQDNGYLMDEDSVETMNQVWLTLGAIETKWNALKSLFAAGFGTVTLSIATNVSGALDALAKYFNASDESERTQALADLRANIEEAFETLRQAIEDGLASLKTVGEELQKSDDPAVKAVGDLLVTLQGALEWMMTHANEVKIAFETIFGLWLVARLSKIATQISGILANITTIKTFSLLQGGASALSNAANTTATTAGATAGTVAGGSILGSLIKGGLPNLLLAWGVWEGVKKWMPSNFLSKAAGPLLGLIPGGETMREVEEIQQAAGIETVGDTVANIQRFDQKSNQRAMGAMWGALWNNGGGAETPAVPPTVLSSEQAAALEAYWDMTRGGEYDRQTYVDLQNAFGDNLDLMNTLVDALDNLPETEYGSEDIPADWWQTQTQIQRGLPENIEGASERGTERGIVKGLSGMRVEIDGAAAGRLLLPYINEGLATGLLL